MKIRDVTKKKSRVNSPKYSRMTFICIWNAVKWKSFCPGFSILPGLEPKFALSSRICWDEIEMDLVKETVEVNVNTFPSEGVEEDVFSMPVSKAQDVAHHGHHSGRPAVCRAAAVPGWTGGELLPFEELSGVRFFHPSVTDVTGNLPGRGIGKSPKKPFMENWGMSCTQHFLVNT